MFDSGHPLLCVSDRVKAEAIASVDQKMDVPKHVMVHHSRNTVEKQWDETRVLVVSGISDTFAKFFVTLSTLDEFQAAWEKVRPRNWSLLARRSLVAPACNLCTYGC